MNLSLFQPTLPVRGATLSIDVNWRNGGISTHAPRAGSDRDYRRQMASLEISTHAPRAGSDTKALKKSSLFFNFNPRSPCGERRLGRPLCKTRFLFQPTLPVRGATASTNKFEALILYHKYNFGIIP